MSVEENKLLARRVVEGAVGERNIDVHDELAAGEFVGVAKRWARSFRSAFPDFEMEIVKLIAEGDRVCRSLQVLRDASRRVAGRAGDGAAVRERF